VRSRALKVRRRSFRLKSDFVIARGSKSAAEEVRVEIEAGSFRGRGACVPYARYGESLETVEAAVESVRWDIEAGAGRDDLPRLLGAGAARNALDCALWDLDAKIAARPVYALAGLPAPVAVETFYTLSLGEPGAMAASALAAPGRLLKMKLAGDGRDVARLGAVLRAASEARLVLDANEGLDFDGLCALLAAIDPARIVMIEQPLPAGADDALADLTPPVPICADESLHVAADVARLADGYQAVNVKLDKAGGLTEAISTVRAAKDAGLLVMTGCMVGSSLAMAPAAALAPLADVVDLDGPLLLAEDDERPIRYDGTLMHPPHRALWG